MDNQTKTIEVAREWCAKKHTWTPICDIPNSDIYSVQFDELSDRQKSEWHDKYHYDECASKESKCKTGFIGQNGKFYKTIVEVCNSRQDFMMVFQTGKPYKKFMQE